MEDKIFGLPEYINLYDQKSKSYISKHFNLKFQTSYFITYIDMINDWFTVNKITDIYINHKKDILIVILYLKKKIPIDLNVLLLLLDDNKTLDYLKSLKSNKGLMYKNIKIENLIVKCKSIGKKKSKIKQILNNNNYSLSKERLPNILQYLLDTFPSKINDLKKFQFKNKNNVDVINVFNDQILSNNSEFKFANVYELFGKINELVPILLKKTVNIYQRYGFKKQHYFIIMENNTNEDIRSKILIKNNELVRIYGFKYEHTAYSS